MKRSLARELSFAVGMVLIVVLLLPLWIAGVVFEACMGRKVLD